MYQSYDKNSDRTETGAKHVKTASFFIKTGFCQKPFAKPLETRVYPPRRPGRGRGADPGLHEAQTGMQRSLSAMLEVLLCLVFASYSAKKVVLYLNDPVLSMVIFAYININIILSAI